MEITKYYFVEFNQPEFDCIYEFKRTKSGASSYGNGSAVVVKMNGRLFASIDTRYDHSVMEDFDKWCREYLLHTLNPELDPLIVGEGGEETYEVMYESSGEYWVYDTAVGLGEAIKLVNQCKEDGHTKVWIEQYHGGRWVSIN